MLLLSEAQIMSLQLDAKTLTDALAAAFSLGEADSRSGLKSQLPSIDGGYIQALPSVLMSRQRAAVKWVNVAGATTSGPRIRATILLSDARTGESLALLAANGLTAVRTAAMSALAARYLMDASARTIGFLGCGAQAQAHLRTFARLYPQLDEVLCYAPSSCERLLVTAAELGIRASSLRDPATLVRRADVVISSVPARADGNRADFDGAWLKPTAFASLVDLGRSWIPHSHGPQDLVVTDYIAQSETLVAAGKMPFPSGFATDLYGLARDTAMRGKTGRRIFVFGGLGMCDAVIADLVHEAALVAGLGTAVDLG